MVDPYGDDISAARHFRTIVKFSSRGTEAVAAAMQPHDHGKTRGGTGLPGRPNIEPQTILAHRTRIEPSRQIGVRLDALVAQCQSIPNAGPAANRLRGTETVRAAGGRPIGNTLE